MIGSADVIYADPPWPWNSRSVVGTKFGGGAGAHYELLSMGDLLRMPVQELASSRSVCFMWAVNSMVPEAIKLLEAWGFSFVTVHTVWVKQSRGQSGKLFKGPGYYSMNNTELLLLGRRGKPFVPWCRFPTTVFAPLQEHSKKPDEVVSRLSAMYPDLYKVELFARAERQDPLWAVWGNEVISDDGVDAVLSAWSKSVCSLA